MSSIQARTSAPVSVTAAALLGLAVAFGSGPAKAEPPIRSPEDAACRLEARAKVFTAPNPKGLDLEDVGRQIYFACLNRLNQAAAPPAKAAGRSHSRRSPQQ